MRLLWLVGLAMGLLLGAQPAVADVCEDLADPLTPSEIADLRQNMLDLIPVRYDAAARSVRIVNIAPGPKDIAPVTRRDRKGGFVVSVPIGFRALQCRLILTHIHFIVMESEATGLEPLMAQCVAGGGRPFECVYRTAKLFAIREFEDGKRLDVESVRGVTEQGMFGVMLHEYAHVVLNHLETGDASMETQADAFALTFGLLGGKSPEAMLATFSGLTFVDDYFSGGLHDSFACRANIANRFSSRMSHRIWPMVFWPLLPDTEYRNRRANPDPYVMAGPLSEAALSRLGCDGDDPQSIALIERDADAILGVLDRVTKVPVPADPFVFYEPLRSLPLSTDPGRYARQFLFGARLGGHFLESTVVEPPEQMFTLADAVLRSPEAQWMPARFYGITLTVRAYTMLEIDAKQGHPLAHLAQLRADLANAVHFYPAFYRPYETRIVLELLAGDCTTGRKVLQQAISVEDDAEFAASLRRVDAIFGRELTQGGCTPERANRLMQALVYRD